MIPIEALRAVKRCVVHANCADGRASAIILHAALPDAEIVEVAHDSTVHQAIEPTEGVLFCDMVPWLPKIGKADPIGDEFCRKCLLSDWVDSGAIVLDHHDGTRDIVSAFGERGVFGENEHGESGAMLAWREVLRRVYRHDVETGVANIRDVAHANTSTWLLAQYASVRDTWQRDNPEWQISCEVSEVLCFLPLDECLLRGAGGVLAIARDIGPILWSKKQKAAEKAAANAVRMTIAGRRVAIISSVSLTSVLGDAVDVVAGFDYHHEGGGVFLKWSLRSHAGVDVSAIARANGGNGHKAAAGFRMPILDATGAATTTTAAKHPYDIIVNILSRS